MREEEPAATFNRFGIAVPGGALRPKSNAVVNKVNVAGQEESSALAGHVEVVGVIHDERRGLRKCESRRKEGRD